MPSYKLTYFGIPGRGEVARALFHYAGVKFEDDRFGFDEWPARKAETPFGQVPVLEVDGVKYSESVAIARYIAKEVNLAGKTNLENLAIDSLIDVFSGFNEKVIDYAFVEKDEIKKKEKHTEIINKTAPNVLGKLDALAKANGGHIALGRLTWADIYFVVYSENIINYLENDIFANFPSLNQVKKNVLAIPNIIEYIKNRPPNPMGKFYSLQQDL